MPSSGIPLRLTTKYGTTRPILRVCLELLDREPGTVEERRQRLQALALIASRPSEVERWRREEVRHRHPVVVRVISIDGA